MKLPAILGIALFIVGTILFAPTATKADTNQSHWDNPQATFDEDSWNPTDAQSPDNFRVGTFMDKGKKIDQIIVPGRPPRNFLGAIAFVPTTSQAAGVNVLPNVPAFDWTYGCVATSAAMLMGYYDNNGYPDMYTGPTNGGVCPLNNSVWGYGECPLSATRFGLDGRATKGHVDDYWRSFGNCSPDPFIGAWSEHVKGDSTADFLGTNQSTLGNCDGSTMFCCYPGGDPLYDYTGNEPTARDTAHGLKLFAESRGYSVTANFNQYIVGYQGNTKGFSFDDFKAEIDAGRPALIHITGHTILGYGYNTAGNLIYIHDTWDHNDHQMTWGGKYAGRTHFGVTVLRLAAASTATPTFAPDGGTYTYSQPVAIASATPGAVVHYTTNGVDPTESDPVANGSILVDHSLTLKARAWKTGLPASNIKSTTFTLSPDAPTITPEGGSYTSSQSVTVSTLAPGAVVRYTLNGQDPSENDPVVTGPVSVKMSTTLKARAFKPGWNPGAVKTASFTITNTCSIPEIKISPNGASVATQSAIVSAAFSGYFYIENDNRSCGIRVNKTGHGLSVGMRADITGTVLTNADGERYVDATLIAPLNPGCVGPVGINNRFIGGSDFFYNASTGAGQKGIVEAKGPNNIGLLVRTTGRVTYADSTCFYIDDGSKLADGSGNIGVKVSANGLSIPPVGTCVQVTAISSCFKSGTGLQRLLCLRTQDDITSLSGAFVSGKVTQTGTQSYSQLVECTHPYPLNANTTWTISGPAGATKMRVHFTKIELEKSYDFLKVLDVNGNVVQTLNTSPAATDVWSSWVNGDTIKLTLTSDYIASYWGFQVDRYEAQTSSTPVAGVTVSLNPGSKTTVTGADGRYCFGSLASGNYTLTPSLAGSVFIPGSRTVSLSSDQAAFDINFMK